MSCAKWLIHIPCLFQLTHPKVSHGLILAQWFCCASQLQPGYMCMSTSPTAADISLCATLILATPSTIKLNSQFAIGYNSIFYLVDAFLKTLP